MKTLILKSPAKLNLHLRILGKRTDGYHDLLTIFQRISLSDKLRIRRIKKGFKLTTDHPTLKTGKTNLISRAFYLLKERFPSLDGISVHLKKSIPLGAGLGGGSSNAATMLLGMKRIFRLPVSEGELLRLGAGLGADIPFFLLRASRAIAHGVGDKLLPAPFPKRLSFILLLTDKGLNTAKIYQNLKIPPQAPSLTKESRIARILCTFFDGKRILEAAVELHSRRQTRLK